MRKNSRKIPKIGDWILGNILSLEVNDISRIMGAMTTIKFHPTIKCLLLVIAFLFQAGCVKGDFPMPTHPGGKIYNGVKRRDVRCFHCHGQRGEGTSQGPALVQSGKTIPPRDFVRAVNFGRGGMPSFKSVLAEKEILLIADWLEKVAALKVDSLNEEAKES